MNNLQAEQALQRQIDDLIRQRRASQDESEKTAINEAIGRLNVAVSAINIAAADELGPKIDAVAADLEKIRTSHRLDALSALGRAANDLKGLARGAR